MDGWKLPYLVLLDEIILVVFWTDLKRLVPKLLYSYNIFVEKNTKSREKSILIRNFCNGVQGFFYYGASLGTVHSY